jgi:LPXTG-motif cell wall-anchored protein
MMWLSDAEAVELNDYTIDSAIAPKKPHLPDEPGTDPNPGPGPGPNPGPGPGPGPSPSPGTDSGSNTSRGPGSEPQSVTDEPTVNLDNPEVPLVNLPEENNVIFDEEVPLVDIPQTGVGSREFNFTMLGLSLSALLAVVCFRKKEEGEMI